MADISDSLKSDLISAMPVERIFQKHVVDGSSFLFRTVLGKIDWEYELRHELAAALNMSIHDIVIVGSAKLGFSLKDQNFTKFDGHPKRITGAQRKSDIDVAVVNRAYFDDLSKQIFSLSRHFDKEWIKQNWQINAFNKKPNKKKPNELPSRYAMYLAKGWLRPDLLPVIYYEIAPWREICQKWSSNLGGRTIAVGFYSEWFYLKHYQMNNLERLRSLLNRMEI